MRGFKYRSDFSEEDSIKFRIRVGYLISGLTLPFIIGFTGLLQNNFLSFLIYFTPVSMFLVAGQILIFFTFGVNIFGLGLIFFSINPQKKGYFLLGLGYFLFMIYLINQIPLNYRTISELPYYIIFIDIPVLIIIVFGFYKIYNFEKRDIPDTICFLPVMFSNIFPYVIYLLSY